jgi:uncharacterized protein (UPF0276 family)
VREGGGLQGIGAGFRPEIAADLLANPAAVDFVEIVAETCFTQARAAREARALAEIWPVVPHGVKLSLGSAEGIDPERARRLGSLARELRAPLVSEHASFTRGRGREIGHLTPLPRTKSAVRALARNVAAARKYLPDVPLLLENIACPLRWPDDELDEGAFHELALRETGCDLLLDLGNLYANARNEGRRPLEALESYPLDRVRMVHIAGGVEEGGFYFDTHAAPVPDGVFELLVALFERTGPVPVLLERDASFPPFAELKGEIDRARAVGLDAMRPGPPDPASLNIPSGTTSSVMADPEAERLATEQEQLATWLIRPEPPCPEAAARFEAAALDRARDVLHRKRIDDALPLLPRTARHKEAIFPLAFAAVVSSPRPPSGAAVADAFRIAEAARQSPRFAEDARADQLILRARFTGPDPSGQLKPRRGPFIGREPMDSGRVLWAIKSLGAGAPVSIYER